MGFIKFIKSLWPFNKSTQEVTKDSQISPHPPTNNNNSQLDYFVRPDKAADLLRCKNTILANIHRYKEVEQKTGVPWDLIAGIHYRESSLDFNGVLHNGEFILGTGKLTRLVPKGRGPFTTWEESAIDALMMKKGIFPTVWTPQEKIIFAEKYNGLGYSKRGLRSPYVWAGTNLQQPGLYVADGKFDAQVIDRRLGVAAIIKGLENLG